MYSKPIKNTRARPLSLVKVASPPNIAATRKFRFRLKSKVKEASKKNSESL